MWKLNQTDTCLSRLYNDENAKPEIRKISIERYKKSGNLMNSQVKYSDEILI
jgi:hypothetical protein